ncbi:MAG: hypothetical protein CFH16_00504 [Alphaproteobacteria bacterium MarineAlpha5_Bin6]|nr:MAG: hypothetical protein CFH17_00506 [Alphaproteobacteria bacterium MarineAlpha5_Bin7]PPR54320.1 MAG: hypothetical protein CFH16_00504 [Alphaproteobacteria bacterium MarineAlpha5_Bin6]|tara:strand:- start:1335 stop:2021 length:687 start_codon:yes stop_codon:yes gene_type:complete
MYIKIIIFISTIIFCFSVYSFPIPKNNEVEYDIIRKNKVIGSHKIKFENNEEGLIVETNINIIVKVLLITAYKFSHTSEELWIDGNFIKINAHTDFEDEREYFIKGEEKKEFFTASGMDGELEIKKNILPSNFWNIKILEEEELFDTQKGIVRKINVKKLGLEEIEIGGMNYNCKKFTFNASNHPKDKGPFPEYTLWYSENDELMKFKFTNWKDNKVVTLIRKIITEN